MGVSVSSGTRPSSHRDVSFFFFLPHRTPSAGFFLLRRLVLPSRPEVISGIAVSQAQENGGREAGDFGIDPLNLADNPARKAKFQLQEIKNGRLAMWAAAGMILQGLTTDGSALDNLFVSWSVKRSLFAGALAFTCVWIVCVSFVFFVCVFASDASF